MPGQGISSWGVAVQVPDADAFAARLRIGTPPVFCRIEDDRVLLDVRTVSAEQVTDLARAVHYAIEGDDFDGEG